MAEPELEHKPGKKNEGKLGKYKWYLIGGLAVIAVVVFYFVNKSKASASTAGQCTDINGNPVPCSQMGGAGLGGQCFDQNGNPAPCVGPAGPPGPPGPKGPKGGNGKHHHHHHDKNLNPGGKNRRGAAWDVYYTPRRMDNSPVAYVHPGRTPTTWPKAGHNPFQHTEG